MCSRTISGSRKARSGWNERPDRPSSPECGGPASNIHGRQVMKKFAAGLLALALAAGITQSHNARADNDENGGVRLVTQNMYVGSSFGALAAAQTPQQVAAAVA